MAISIEGLFASSRLGNIFSYLCICVSTEIRHALKESAGIPTHDCPGYLCVCVSAEISYVLEESSSDLHMTVQVICVLM